MADWELVARLVGAPKRRCVLERLRDGPSTPSKIAAGLDMAPSHVSRALRELEDERFAEKVSTAHRAAIYRITADGERLLREIEKAKL